MPEKIAPGVWSEASQRMPERDEVKLERYQVRKTASMWAVAAGVGMMFLGGVSATLALGGAAMALGGGISGVYWSRKAKKLKGDPWAPDPEIDAWEEEQMLRRTQDGDDEP